MKKDKKAKRIKKRKDNIAAGKRKANQHGSPKIKRQQPEEKEPFSEMNPPRNTEEFVDDVIRRAENGEDFVPGFIDHAKFMKAKILKEKESR